MASPNFAKTIPDSLCDLSKLSLFYGERGHDNHDVAQRTNKDPPVAGGHADLPTDGVGRRE